MTDADQFEAFVREFQNMVFRTAVRLLGRPADAEDVAQTVFLKAFERFDVIGQSPNAAGWLKTVTTNLCLNHLSRHRSRWRLFSELEGSGDDADRPQPFADSIPAADPGDAEPAHAVEEQRLEQALRGLPPHQRVPLVLFHFDEQSYQDIAATLGVSLGKVKTDIHRGREALRRVLTEDERDSPAERKPRTLNSES
jgi:RNA polymerase sigma-70 factor (ECF subfamily)